MLAPVVDLASAPDARAELAQQRQEADARRARMSTLMRMAAKANSAPPRDLARIGSDADDDDEDL